MKAKQLLIQDLTETDNIPEKRRPGEGIDPWAQKYIYEKTKASFLLKRVYIADKSIAVFSAES